MWHKYFNDDKSDFGLGLRSLSKQMQKVLFNQKRFGGMHDAHNCTLCSNPKVDIFKIKVLIGYSYKSTSV